MEIYPCASKAISSKEGNMTFVDIADYPLHDTKFSSQLCNEKIKQNIGIFLTTKFYFFDLFLSISKS